MILLRKLLFPFAIVYGVVTSIRNYLYDNVFLVSYSFPVPVIVVGNLSVGGTGKTPLIEYLITLLNEKYAVATLSRGYKRHSKGFILADATSDAATLGDEPFQMHQKFPNIQVAVDVDRKNGIEQLLSQTIKPDTVLLDDAYQHRRVKAGFYILLTAYDDLYSDDFMLPAGNLRESRRGAHRANCIIVTKCPKNISVEEQNQIKNKLKAASNQKVYFAYIHYDDKIYSENKSVLVSEIKTKNKLLLAGIAKPQPFFAYLQHENDPALTFPDHHHFTQSDIETIKKKAREQLIVTTEKDYVRLKTHIPVSQLFYLPIKTSFVSEGNNFDKTILNYVGTSTRNR